MTDFKKLQLEVEEYFLSKNKPLPISWNWEKNDKGLFYIEKSTGKKRYGTTNSCKFCKRQFIVKKHNLDIAIYCSKVCDSLSREKKIETNCAWCNKEIKKTESKLKNSKHNLNFCNRICKENAQKIDGITELHPKHYKDGTSAYNERALRFYGGKCCDCGLTFKPLLSVHHVDGNRENGKLENLEVLCSLHHDLRHMYFNEKKNIWIYDTKSLTPRDKLDELRNLLKILK